MGFMLPPSIFIYYFFSCLYVINRFSSIKLSLILSCTRTNLEGDVIGPGEVAGFVVSTRFSSYTFDSALIV